MTRSANLKVKLVFEDGTMIGPGKSDLLAGIAETGSIAAAGRRMNMSYKRAWSLVQTMNGMFKDPLVARSRGGAQGGQATLTDTGHTVLDSYRELVAAAGAASSTQVKHLQALRPDDKT